MVVTNRDDAYGRIGQSLNSPSTLKRLLQIDRYKLIPTPLRDL